MASEDYFAVGFESDDERRNLRSRRQEESSYEAHSTKDSYYYPGEHCAEQYTSAPVIIGRPFTEEVDSFPAPPSFKMPPCESYDGTGDPMEHLAHFTSGIYLHLVPDQIMCRASPVTLKGAAHVWFQHLAPRSISCWAQLAESFRSPKESLKSYYARFNTEKLLIDNLDPGVTFAAMARGVKPGTSLRFLLNKRPPENMTNLHRVEKYLRAEEDSMTTQDERTSGQKRRDHPEGRIPEEPKRSRATLSKHLTPLTTTREHILNQIKSQNILKWPKPMRMPADKRDASSTAISIKIIATRLKNVKFFRVRSRTLSRRGTSSNLSRQMNAREDGEAEVKEGTRSWGPPGSSADILFEEAFSQMQISRDQIRSVSSPLYGFTGASAPVEGVLKNIKNFEWTAECQASFEALKNYLSAPLLLSKPLVGEELFLYLAIADSAVSAVLVREQDGKQLPIYYVSKVLQGAELRYPDAEKLAFALLVAAQKLRPYFQSHSITVLTDKPLRIEEVMQQVQKDLWGRNSGGRKFVAPNFEAVLDSEDDNESKNNATEKECYKLIPHPKKLEMLKAKGCQAILITEFLIAVTGKFDHISRMIFSTQRPTYATPI
ncbi:hypothetical protein RJ639_028658 [Escallonia herrerae]|uniref:Reverse transcriptase/retrotransposon-derived protein RNase H-like domain-containing protein n=1 Tax=Escallonia herrerae TaxID=1293975 RepID=A0AA88XAU5_9ASTE|nr:hypothetical protein RJ639_028658 [Escallonia herrerae]